MAAIDAHSQTAMFFKPKGGLILGYNPKEQRQAIADYVATISIRRRSVSAG